MKKIIPVLLLMALLFQTRAQASSLRETPVVKVVRSCAPAVVNISTEKIAYLKQDPFWGGYGNAMDSVFRNFYGPSIVNAVKLKSLGSGVVIRADGLIVTNAHVINMATKIFVIFNDGKSVPARTVLVSQTHDLAIIKVDMDKPIQALPLSKPDDVLIGETVVAIGNPFGLENSVSAGVISGKNRTFALNEIQHVFSDLLQTDAPINIGNSGGALINLDGELVGINLAVVQEAQSIGFAIPSKKIKEGIDFYDQNAKTNPIAANSNSSSGTVIPVKIQTQKNQS